MRRHLFFALAALVLLVSAPMYGQNMQLVLNDNAGNEVVFDVDGLGVVSFAVTAGCDDLGECVFPVQIYNALNDSITVQGVIGQFTINNIIGQGGVNNVTQVHQNLTQSEASSLGDGLLSVLFTDINYPNLGQVFSMSGTITNNAQSSGSSVQFDMGVGAAGPLTTGAPDPAPLLPGGTLPLLTCETTGTCVDGATNSAIANTFGNPGNITAYKQIEFDGSGTVQTTLTITSTVIPEPASVALFGTVMLISGVGLRRKFGRRA